MASSLCRSTSLINVFLQRITVLDIIEVKSSIETPHGEWAYVIAVTWSDMRENKVYRSYADLSSLYNLVYKLRYSDKSAKTRNWPNIPKVPVRGFFDWSTIKLMVRHQAKVDSFLRVLVDLPGQISRYKDVLDFFELRDSDNRNHILTQRINHSTNPYGKGPGPNTHSHLTASCNNNYPGHDNYETMLSTNQRSRAPPNFLAVTSCFEPDDDIPDVTNGYQTLLEDVTSLNLYEDYDNLYKTTPNGSCLSSHRHFHNASLLTEVKSPFEEEKWLRECEEIISPYSPNKAYFRLVHVLENQCDETA